VSFFVDDSDAMGWSRSGGHVHLQPLEGRRLLMVLRELLQLRPAAPLWLRRVSFNAHSFERSCNTRAHLRR
jgi:hypothetical protein